MLAETVRSNATVEANKSSETPDELAMFLRIAGKINVGLNSSGVWLDLPRCGAVEDSKMVGPGVRIEARIRRG